MRKYLIIATLISYLQWFGNCCNQFLDEKQRTLIIPENETCEISDDKITSLILEEIQINGILQIKDSFNLNIKYKKMTIAEKGKLEIGKNSQIMNNLIVLEQIGNDSCIEPSASSKSGSIFIQALPYETYNFQDSQKNSKVIQATSKISNLIAKQEILIIDPLLSIEPETLQMEEIKELNIYLKKEQQFDYFTQTVSEQNKKKIQPFLFSNVPTISGVVLKNTCLSGTIEKFIGVTIVNPKGLYFTKGSISFSMIKFDNNNNNKSIQINSENGMINTLFIGCNDINLIIGNRNTFKNNIIAFSKNLTITMKNYGIQNVQFIKSSVNIDLKLINILSINSASRFYNCDVNVIHNENLEVDFDDILFYQGSFMKFSQNSIQKFTGVSLYYFQQILDFSNAIIQKGLTLKSSLIDGNGQFNHLIIMKQQDNLQQKISLQKNTFLGYKSYFITSSDMLTKQQDSLFARQIGDISFDLELNQNTFNSYQIDQKNILNLKNMLLVVKRSDYQKFCVVQIDKQNLENQYIITDSKWAGESAYALDDLPSYYQVSNIIADNNIQTNEIIIKAEDQVVELNKFYQIITEQIKNIYFYDQSNNSIDITKFYLKLDQIKNLSTNKEKILTFNFQKKAIKSITISEITEGKNTVIKISDAYENNSYRSIQFFWFKSLNQLYFSWKSIVSSNYEISIEYCKENELFDGTSCVQTCSGTQQQSGLFCAQTNCSEGYFKVDNKCQKCQLGCKKCSTDNKCDSCFDFYFLQDGKCIDVCKQSQKMKGNQCQPCDQSCSSCYERDECYSCSKAYLHDEYDGVCLKCEDNKILVDQECVSCPQSCKKCIDNTEYGCIECADGYERIFGICKKKVNNFYKVCDVGQSSINNSCQQCDSGCFLCELNYGRIQCTTCLTNSKKSILGGGCEKCKGGMFDSKESSYDCSSCHSLCNPNFSCQGPSIFQCDKCKNGYYKELGTNKCLPCDQSCEECSNESTSCTKCKQNQFLQDNKCLNACNSGYFADASNTCQKCDIKCKECSTNSSNCTACSYKEVLFEGQCLQKCLDGYFANNQSICVTCDLNKCEQCIQYSTKCTKCKEGLFLYDFGCMPMCPEKGYFADAQNKCQPCHEDCEKCEGTPNHCTDCELPLVLEGNQCQMQCPVGKYGSYKNSISQCLDCDTKLCKACSLNKTNCTECNAGSYLYQNRCIQSCPEGTMQHEATSTCMNCIQPHCKQCEDNILQCSLCQDSYYQLAGICVKQCPSGYFLNDNQKECLPCDKRICMECQDSPTTCTKCYPEHFRINSTTCGTLCPKLMFPLRQGNEQICFQCHDECTQGCVGPTQNQCLEPSYIIEESTDRALMIIAVVLSFILFIAFIILAIFYYRKHKLSQKPYLIRSFSSTESLKMIQMENQQSEKQAS